MHNTGKRPMRTPHILITVLLGIMLPLHQVVADADGELETLARIIHELEALDPLIGEAVSQANPDARIRFNYAWLRHDLVKIQQGLQEHIDAPRSEPRTFPPLRGDYRR